MLMAAPIFIASALARTVTITCPWCKTKKLVARKPAAFRVCPHCKKQFPDPLATKRR
jgi:transposase-like protein